MVDSMPAYTERARPGTGGAPPNRLGGNSSTAALFGISAVALLIGGTRWSSYIGVPPLFLTDVLLLFGFANLFISQLAKVRSGRGMLESERRGTPIAIPLAGAVAVYAAFRAVLGIQYGLVGIRDAMPYLYAILTVVVYFVARSADAASMQGTFRILVWALRFHAAWFVLVMLIDQNLPATLPFVSTENGLHVFSVRGDVDTALAGVYAAMLTRNVFVGVRHRNLTLVAIVVVWLAILQTGSRAGLFGAMVATAAVGLFLLFSTSVKVNYKMALVAVAPLLAIALILVLPSTDIGQRVLSTFGLATSTSIVDGAGTAEARSDAWDRLVEYNLEDSERLLFGVGFGPNFMRDSGAEYLLVGEGTDGTTRSPHNYWLGTASRLGVIGVSLFALLIATVVASGWRARHWAISEPLWLLCFMIPLSLIVPATLGVVLESPFGAVPFFWCLGVMNAISRQARVAIPIK